MATFGNSSAADTGSTSQGANYLIVAKYTLSENGTLTGLYGRVYNSGGSTYSAKLLLYDNDGIAGAPGTKLYSSPSGTSITIGNTVWVSGTPSNSLTMGDYWLGVVFNGGMSAMFSSATGGTDAVTVASGSYTTPPSTHPTLGNSYAHQLELYATYTPGGGGTATDLSSLIAIGIF